MPNVLQYKKCCNISIVSCLFQLTNNNKDLNDTVLLIVQFLPSLTITMLNVIVPAIFDKVVLVEDYMPAFAIRITLIRYDRLVL